ncbi:MAG: MgtE protein [Desulfurivibrio sp.]|nr:MgtE protein [Desulfurivibrio sp.]
MLATAPSATMLRAAESEPVRATPEELDKAATLRDKEDELEQREAKIARREQELAEMEQRLKEELAELLAQQEKARATLEELTAAKGQAYRELIKIYSAMRNSRVAELLGEMSDRDALEILRGLDAEAVADIIPRLERDKAVRLSRQLGLL